MTCPKIFQHFARTLSLLLMMLGGVAAVEPAASFMIIDHHSGKVLAHKNANQKMPIASITNVATACVVLDWADITKTNLSQQMTVPQSAAAIGGPNAIGLRPGDRLSVRDGLYAALMSSDNIAAETLAHHAGEDFLRRRGQQGYAVPTFVRELNALAGKLGMRRTRFLNAHGMDYGTRKKPYSTAADVCRLCQYAMNKSGFRFYVAQKTRTITVDRFGQRQRFRVKNTNSLVGSKGIDGIKTGQIPTSGPCLAVSSKRKNQVTKLPDGRSQIQKRRVTGVVLNAQDRFRSGSQLVDIAWRQLDGWNAAGRPNYNPRDFLQGF